MAKTLQQIKLFTVTSSKPENLEKQVNSFIKTLESDDTVESYSYEIMFSNGTLLAVFYINKIIDKEKE